jgi:hypothetical protein
MTLLLWQTAVLRRDISVAGEAGNGDTAIGSSTEVAMHDHVAVHVERR